MNKLPAGYTHIKGVDGVVKGVSKQVIVVRSPDPALFEQAIFILKEDVAAHGVTDEMLMKQACRAAQSDRKRHFLNSRPLWAGAGAMVTGLIWMITALL